MKIASRVLRILRVNLYPLPSVEMVAREMYRCRIKSRGLYENDPEQVEASVDKAWYLCKEEAEAIVAAIAKR